MSLILEALRKSEAERRRMQAPNVFIESPPSSAVGRPGSLLFAGVLGVAVVVAIGTWLGTRATRRTAPAPHVASTGVIAPPMRSADALPPVAHLTPSPRVAPLITAKPPAPATRTPPTQPPQPTLSEPPVASTPAPSPPSAQTTRDALQLSDLTIAERQALPPLKLSMHLWNADPAQRFVILDGNRLHEGDRVGDAVVGSIVPDGVILEWSGRRIKLLIR